MKNTHYAEKCITVPPPVTSCATRAVKIKHRMSSKKTIAVSMISCRKSDQR